VLFVLDASALLADLLGERIDRLDPGGLAPLLEQHDAIVPSIFMLEVLNVLVKAERRERGKSALLDRRLQAVRNRAVTTDDETALNLETTTLSLARTHRLSIFDATYLELALRRTLPLATFDNGLIRAAQAERVPLLP
jgi:predicted nucleic acid-binding protein